VGDHDAAPDHQPHREDLQELLARDAFLVAPYDVIRDAVVTASKP